MFTIFADSLFPIFGQGLYIGGGIVTLLVIVLVLFLLFR